MSRIGVVVREYSAATREQQMALDPDFLITNIQRVPKGETLWPGTWQWAVYEVQDFSTALHWGERGADFVLSHFAAELQLKRQAFLDAQR